MRKKFLTLFSCSMLALSAEEMKYSSFTFKHIESGGVGYDMGYTTFQAFFSANPSWGWASPFLDARAHVFDNGKWATNAGIGARRIFGDRIYGLNAYYDYRGTKHLTYNQIGVGFETLGSWIDARINGYLPLGKKVSAGYDARFDSFSGHSMILAEKREFAMKGLDAEVGFHIGKCSSWNCYAATGPYYYHGSLGENAWGGKVRFSVNYQQYASFEVIESYDNVFHNNIQGRIAFSFPLGPKSSSERSSYSKKLRCRMAQPPARSEIVVVDHKQHYPIAIDPATGAPYYFVFVDNTSSSTGTYESPYHSLAQAQANSEAGQIIYVFPGNGTTTNMDHGIVLKPSQKLWGSASNHLILTAAGSVTVPSLSTSAPQITNSDMGGVGVTLSTNNEVSGLTILQTASEAIAGVDPRSFSLSSCTLIACGQDGMGVFPVNIQASSPLVANFNGNTFQNNVNGGVYIELNAGASSAFLTITNNQATGNQATTGGAALFNIDPNGSVGVCSLYMTKNSCTNNPDLIALNIQNIGGGGAGSFSSFKGSISENIFTQNKQAIAYAANASSSNISITNNDLSNNGTGSVQISAGNGQVSNLVVTLNANQMSGASDSGANAVNLSTPCEEFTCSITNNTISNNDSSAILFFRDMAPLPNMDFTIANNTISNNQNSATNGAGGISIDGFNTLILTIEENQFSNNSGGNAIGTFGNSVPAPLGDAVLTFRNNQLLNGDLLNFQFWGASPTTGCLLITGNTNVDTESLSAPVPGVYTFFQASTGSCTIVPCNYAEQNIGEFNLTGVSPAQSCSGKPCE